MAWNNNVTVRDVHERLTEIGVPEDGDNATIGRRISHVYDRLCLRPEGEPDTADLVGRVNEACDAAGIKEGDPAVRVTWLAGRCQRLLECVANLESDLKAERAQLAAATKPERQNVDRAALIRVIKMCAEELT